MRVTSRGLVGVLFLATSVMAAFHLGCGRDAAVPRDGDGLDVSKLPQQVREDYALFANRCSKCHSLARPLALATRETSDAFWERYVERMRRQPGSGISAEDEMPIRRFLHFYSRIERERQNGLEADAGSSLVPPPPTAAPPAVGTIPSALAQPPDGATSPIDGGP